MNLSQYLINKEIVQKKEKEREMLYKNVSNNCRIGDEYNIKLSKEKENEKIAQIRSLFCSLHITHTQLYPSFTHTPQGNVLHDNDE
jgi:hypothetical protein